MYGILKLLLVVGDKVLDVVLSGPHDDQPRLFGCRCHGWLVL